MGNNRAKTHGSKQDHGHQPGPRWKRLHRDWKAWVVVVLMLAAMAMYVLSEDESLQPGEDVPGPPAPAATGI